MTGFNIGALSIPSSVRNDTQHIEIERRFLCAHEKNYYPFVFHLANFFGKQHIHLYI